LILSGLEKLSSEEATSVLESVIQSASDLSVLSAVIREIVGDSHPDGSKSEPSRVNLGDEAVRARDMLIDRIRSLVSDGRFWYQAKPENLLWFWWGADKEPEVRQFTQREMDTTLGLRGLLASSIGMVRSSEGNY